MLVGRTFSVFAIGVVLVGCCGTPRPCCPPPCSRPAAPAAVAASLPMPRPTPPAGDGGARVEALQSRATILNVLDEKRVQGAQFARVSLDEVATYLRTVTGLTFVITPKVRATTFDSIKVNIPALDDVTTRQILDIVVGSYGLRWEVVGDAVHIGTPEEFAGPLRLRYFDVKDLVAWEPPLALAPSSSFESPAAPGPVVAAGDAFVQRVKASSGWARWGAIDGTSIDLKSGTLIVRGPAEALDAVGEHLESLRAAAGAARSTK